MNVLSECILMPSSQLKNIMFENEVQFLLSPGKHPDSLQMQTYYNSLCRIWPWCLDDMVRPIISYRKLAYRRIGKKINMNYLSQCLDMLDIQYNVLHTLYSAYIMGDKRGVYTIVSNTNWLYQLLYDNVGK